MGDFCPEDLAAKIDYEGGIAGGALLYFGPRGPKEAPQRVKRAWGTVYVAIRDLWQILEEEGVEI